MELRKNIEKWLKCVWTRFQKSFLTYKTSRIYFFLSTHYPRSRAKRIGYNETHPCYIIRRGNGFYAWERGTYYNSHRRISKFRGLKIGILDYGVSFGMISGYKPKSWMRRMLNKSGEMPYVLFHSKSAFHIPAFMVFPGQLWIVCKYQEKSMMEQYNDLVSHWRTKKRNANRFIWKRYKR